MEATINKIIDEFNLLDLNDREYVLDIIQKQFIEAKREELLQSTKEAENNYGQGNVKRGSAADLLKDLAKD